MYVQVTVEDLEAALAWDRGNKPPLSMVSMRCPVAQALRRTTSDEWSVGIDRVWCPRIVEPIRLCDKGKKIVRLYDDRNVVGRLALSELRELLPAIIEVVES